MLGEPAGRFGLRDDREDLDGLTPDVMKYPHFPRQKGQASPHFSRRPGSRRYSVLKFNTGRDIPEARNPAHQSECLASARARDDP